MASSIFSKAGVKSPTVSKSIFPAASQNKISARTDKTNAFSRSDRAKLRFSSAQAENNNGMRKTDSMILFHLCDFSAKVRAVSISNKPDKIGVYSR